jgi:hypothetical protein
MGQGMNAYASYVRIHEELGRPALPSWRELSHVRRMAWEAAAQAVARSVLPSAFGSESSDGEPYDDEDCEDDDHESDDEGLDVD